MAIFQCYKLTLTKPPLVAQMVKCLPTVRETRVRSLSREDPLEKEMATHSSILAWKIPWTEKPGGLQSMELQRVGHDLSVYHFTDHLLCVHQQSRLDSIRQIRFRLLSMVTERPQCVLRNWTQSREAGRMTRIETGKGERQLAGTASCSHVLHSGVCA